ncbi:unnamed protein product [Rodentolepis nana]|uniref:Uncharacterized protein n=1 Tax=Rodentolepis nana TaxID=102285 RepID=A0A0R3TBS0_RODNA|nr:unnamed protein product [Rodentolepis nana]
MWRDSFRKSPEFGSFCPPPPYVVNLGPEVIQQFWQQIYRYLPDPALPNRHSDGQQMGIKMSIAIESTEFGHTYDDFVMSHWRCEERNIPFPSKHIQDAGKWLLSYF